MKCLFWVVCLLCWPGWAMAEAMVDIETLSRQTALGETADLIYGLSAINEAAHKGRSSFYQNAQGEYEWRHLITYQHARKGIKMTIATIWVNCQKGSIETNELKAYGVDGQLIRHVRQPQWLQVPVAEGEMGGDIVSFVCDVRLDVD